MKFNDYQDFAKSTAVYPNVGKNFIYPTLGLAGEAGEVAEKIKKIIRDQNSELNDSNILEIRRELGDVLWYVAMISAELGIKLEDVVMANMLKLNSRKERGEIHGSGDNR